MARPQETFNKKEKEKLKLKKKQEKQLKKDARKASGKTDDMFVYVDENGHLTSTPPDPSKKIVIEAEDIEIGIPKKEDVDEVPTDRKGTIDYFDTSKGFGFIIDIETNEKHFTHVSGIIDDIAENDKVTFELEKGQRGMNAVKVKQA